MELGLDGGPQLEGTKWWSKDGRDHFTIREILMGPEGFTVRTTDGRMLDAGVMETYIQSEVPIMDMMQHDSKKIDISGLDEVDGDSIVVDDHTESKSFGSLKYTHPDIKFQQSTRQRMVKKDNDPINEPLADNPNGKMDDNTQLDAISFGMIDRVLGNTDFEELVSINMNPTKKIDDSIVILTNTLNIKHSEIKMYMIDHIIDKIESMIDKAITTYLDNLYVKIGEETNNESSSLN